MRKYLHLLLHALRGALMTFCTLQFISQQEKKNLREKSIAYLRFCTTHAGQVVAPLKPRHHSS